MENGNKMIASNLQLRVETPESKFAKAIMQKSRSCGKTAELEKLKSQYCERICRNCKCMVSIREGYNAGKHQCVVIDPKNPHAPHVHFTMPHFKCSNNKFESKYGK